MTILTEEAAKKMARESEIWWELEKQLEKFGEVRVEQEREKIIEILEERWEMYPTGTKTSVELLYLIRKLKERIEDD